MKILENKHINLQELSNLSYAARQALEIPEVRAMMQDGHITMDQILRLSHNSLMALKIPEVRAMMQDGHITMDQILRLSHNSLMALKIPEVCAMLQDGHITMDEVLQLSYEARQALEIPEVREMLKAGVLSLQELSSPQVQALRAPEVCEMVRDGYITMEQVLQLSYEASHALEIPEVCEMVRGGYITMEQVSQISDYAQVRALQIPEVREMVRGGSITMEQVLQMTDYPQFGALSIPEVCEMVRAGSITMEQVLQLSYPSKEALEIPEVREMVRGGSITMDQVLQLSDNSLNALRDQETRQRIIDGDIAIEDIIGAPVINDAQSTHNSSVHKSVSDSATKLMNRYGGKIDGLKLEDVIEEVKNQVSSLSDESDENKAAKRCIQRLTAGDYAYTDKESGVTTRQLLALVFLAISDSGQRKGEMKDVMVLCVRGLYEIQRGYNLNDAGEDDGETDSPICAGGTFNKLINALQGVHPDFELKFRTRTTAALKLSALVKEKAQEYLSQQANPQSKADLLSFTKLIAEIKKDGYLRVIYNQIRDSVADDMFDEFGSLYKEDRSDQSFVALIDSGAWSNPPNLDQFQEQIQNSKGYHKYCSDMLRRSTATVGGLFPYSTYAKPIEIKTAGLTQNP